MQHAYIQLSKIMPKCLSKWLCQLDKDLTGITREATVKVREAAEFGHGDSVKLEKKKTEV